tara:strand:- start:5368 stop:5736 length:369 start_codon:yes stop_codon:yes gene_type:complete
MSKLNVFDADIEIQPESLNLLNFVAFRKFLIENNVMALAVSYVIGNQINNLMNSIMDNILDPFINGDYNRDNKEDLRILKNWSINTGFHKFKTGQLIYDLIKFIVVIYCTFITSRLFIDYIN